FHTAAFDHYHSIRCSGYNEIKVQPVGFREVGVCNKSAVKSPYAYCPNRTIERNVGDVNCSGHSNNAQYVRNVFVSVRQNGHDSLCLRIKAFGEQRSYRPVDESGGQYFFLGRFSFSLEKAARYFPCRVSFFLIIYREGEEVQTLFDSLVGNCRGKDNGITVS